MNPSTEIPVGSKFSAIGLTVHQVAVDVPTILRLADDTLVTRELPAELKSWQEWLGTLEVEEIASVPIWIVVHAIASELEVADRETAQLDEQAHVLYHALVISVPNMGHEYAVRVGGVNIEGTPEVRSYTPYDAVNQAFYSPPASVGRAELVLAARLASAIAKLRDHGDYGRKWRVVRTFFGASQATEWGTRLHQYVRCLEGFTYPRRGKTREDFGARTALFLGPGYREVAEQMYDIRSGVEHLHGPFRFLPAIEPRARHLLLLRRTIEAEALARYCLIRFLEHEHIWPYFEDSLAIEQFWEHLTDSQRRAIWGEPFDLGTATAEFHEEWIEDRDLGL